MRCKYRKGQFSLHVTLVIPDTKPDIERILRVTSTPTIDKVSVIAGKVIIAGTVLLFVEYIACSHLHTQPLHGAEFNAPFAHFLEHPKARCSHSAAIAAQIEFQEVQLLDRRTLSVFMIIETEIIRFDQASITIRSQVCPPQHISNSLPQALALSSTEICALDCSASHPCANTLIK